MHTIKKNQKITIGAVAVVIAIIVFYGGMKYGQHAAASTVAQTQGGQNGQLARGTRGGAGRSGGFGAGSGFTTGDVLSKDARSLAIKLRSGGSILVFFGSSTPIMKSTSGTSDDIQIGSQVMVAGSTNTDGSLNAQSIQIRPASPAAGTTSTI